MQCHCIDACRCSTTAPGRCSVTAFMLVDAVTLQLGPDRRQPGHRSVTALTLVDALRLHSARCSVTAFTHIDAVTLQARPGPQAVRPSQCDCIDACRCSVTAISPLQ